MKKNKLNKELIINIECPNGTKIMAKRKRNKTKRKHNK